MLGLMQDHPLLVSSLLVHAARHHGDAAIVSRSIEGPIHRTSVREVHGRARRLANALRRQGVGEGDRVATLAWNTWRHIEVYFAVSGMGAVCHTVNPRLFEEQIVFIINHAEDRLVFFDLGFAPLVAALMPRCPGVKGWVAMTDAAHMAGLPPGSLCYETLLAAESDEFDWPVLDERTASSLCYTSGTTGNPKGVLYSHRSNILHTYGGALVDTLAMSARDVVLPVVPMFHANAWGLPYICMMVGAAMVMPGAALDGKSLYELLESEKVTFTAGVPTVWLGLLAFLKDNGCRLSTVNRVLVGGSALPAAMARIFEEDYGIEVLHGWGMTEMSPVGSVSQLKAKHVARPSAERLAVKVKQGRTIFGVDFKIVDGAGTELPWDGQTFGDLLVKGPWIARAYFKEPSSALGPDGWFPTGDVATIDPDGYIQITDRSKDVIKSGGEWISSIELENIAIGHPAVAEAAVIGVTHVKWGERPLLIVQARSGAAPTRDEILDFYAGKVAKWWVPDDVVFVASLPHTATGKLLKTQLRRDFADYRLPVA
jgi:fatty-acyl-CoA synthase